MADRSSAFPFASAAGRFEVADRFSPAAHTAEFHVVSEGRNAESRESGLAAFLLADAVVARRLALVEPVRRDLLEELTAAPEPVCPALGQRLRSIV